MTTLGRGSHRDAAAPVKKVAHRPVPAQTVTATGAARWPVPPAPAGGPSASASPSSWPAKGTITAPTAARRIPVPLTWNLTQATDWGLTQTTDWGLMRPTGRNLRQAQELTPS